MQSSNLTQVWYDAEAEILQITFDPINARGYRTGIARTYSYAGVPLSVFVNLLDAPSKGIYHAKYIKWRYAYTEV